MKNLLRKLRGILGTGLTWAVGWAGVWAGLWVVTGNSLGRMLGAATNGAVLGLIAGGTFALILSVVERKRTLHDLSLKRVALWGGIGGMALLLAFLPTALEFSAIFGGFLTSYVVPLALNGLLGAGSAAGSVALARRGDTDRIGEMESAGFLSDGD